MFRAVLTLSLACLAAPTWAQNAATVNPRHYTVAFENDVVRVLSADHPPGERSEMHAHPPSVTIFLSDSHFLVTYPDGDTSEPRIDAGSVNWGPGTIHEVRNTGTTNARLMIVEFKSARVSEGVRQRVSPAEPLQLGQGVIGHALIDNDLVAVRQLSIDAGAGRDPHTNSDRDLLVLPRLGRLTLEVEGTRLTLEPGQVRLVSRGTPHTEHNEGAEPSEWIALRLERFAPILVLAGVVFFQFTQRSRLRGFGQMLLALGFIFLGILTIRDGSDQLDPTGDLARLIEIAVAHPWFTATLAVNKMQ